MSNCPESPIKSVCVYCGSRTGNDTYAQAAHQLGTRIAATGRSLVYGAGSIGLMGITARAVIAGGGSVTGIIPEHLNDIEIIQDGLSETIITKNMHDRKRLMFDKSDAFLVLPAAWVHWTKHLKLSHGRSLGCTGNRSL